MHALSSFAWLKDLKALVGTEKKKNLNYINLLSVAIYKIWFLCSHSNKPIKIKYSKTIVPFREPQIYIILSVGYKCMLVSVSCTVFLWMPGGFNRKCVGKGMTYNHNQLVNNYKLCIPCKNFLETAQTLHALWSRLHYLATDQSKTRTLVC